MKCDTNTLKDMRQTLLSAAVQESAEKGAIGPDGESFDLTAAFYRNLASQIRDPASILAELDARDTDLSKPFHIHLRKEFGEELFVETAKGAEKHYLLSSYTVDNPDALGGVDIVVRLAPASNVASTKEFLFRLNSDTSIESIGREVGTIYGMGEMSQRALLNSVKEIQSNRVKEVVIDSEGDPELNTTLKKMAAVDTVLHSRQNRNASSMKGYEEMPNYEHGNIESMKEMLGKLHVLGGSRASPTLLSYYMDLIDSMHPRFFNQMKLLVKRNNADTWGEVDTGANTIRVDVAKQEAQPWQSEAEIYVHELIHTMTSWALRQKDVDIGPIRMQLNHAMAVAKTRTKWQDLLEVPESQATRNQKKEAQDIHDYLFVGETSVDEFIAYTLSNPQVMKHMQGIKLSNARAEPQTVFERITALVGKVLNVITGRFNFKDSEVSVFDKINDLSFRLAEVNNRHRAELKNMNPVGKMMLAIEDAIGNVDHYLSDKLHQLRDKVKHTDPNINVPPADASLYQHAKFYLKLGVAALTNPIHRGAVGVLASAWGVRPNGTIREILSSFFERSSEFRIAEALNLLSTQVDASRNSVINASSKSLKDAFTRKLSVDEDSAITRAFLNTNLAALRYKRIGRTNRPDTETRKLLTDADYRQQQIGRLKNKIEKELGNDRERYRWTVAQATSLGYYMATGKAHVAQNYNAMNIVLGYGSNVMYERNPGLATLVEELASITSVNYVAARDRVLVAELLRSEKKGIDAITDAYEAYRQSSAAYLFRDSPAHMMTGHTVELMDDSVDVTIAPASQASELAQKGYTLRYELEPKNGDTYKSPMALYTTGTWGKASRTRGTVGLGKLHAKGTTLRSLKRVEDPGLAQLTHNRDFARVQANAVKLHEAMRNGTFDVSSVEYGMGPVIDITGRTTDFRYMMSKENKEELLGQDMRATQVLPRSMGNVTHNIAREQLNADALNAIKEDMANSWESGSLGKDGISEFSLIGPTATDPAMRELYAMLPETYREFIDSRTDKTMAVRTDLLNIYFGDKDFKLSNAAVIKHLPGLAKTVIDIAEGVWQELIKISKGAILLKMPLVLLFNFLSNVRYQINTGSLNLVQLGRDYKESAREVNEYLRNNRRTVALRLEIDSAKQAKGRVRNSGELENIIKEKKTELLMLERALENNPAKELFDAGLYQSHIQDIENSALGDANRITRTINNRLDSAPVLVRGAAEIAYLTQNTAWYKFSQEALQRTDMITRLVDSKREMRKERRMIRGEIRLPRWWLEEKRKNNKTYPDKKVMSQTEGVEFLQAAKTVRMQQLLDNYINYTLPNGTFEEYLNKMGVLMFTKYIKRVQPVIANAAMNHPLKTTLTVLTAGAISSGDIIQDQAIISRGFDPRGTFSLSNLVPIYSPSFHLENVFTPPIVKDELRMGLF